MHYSDVIIRDPKILGGKPIIKGTRISVALVVKKIAAGHTVGTLIEAYPHLNAEQITAALNYAADLVAGEIVLEHT